MSLTKKQFYKNSVWTTVELILFPVLVIFSTPYFISKLGIEQYGLWMLITTITQGLNILMVGVGDSNIKFISKYRANKEEELISKVFKFNFSFSIFLFFIAAITGFLLSEFNFVSFFYKSENYDLANKLIFLTALSWGLKFIETSVLSAFKGFERFDIYSKLSTNSKCSVVIISMLMLALGFKLDEVIVASLFLSAFNILLELFVLHRFNSSIITWPNVFFWTDRKDYLAVNFWYWLQWSIALYGFLADKLIIAKLTDVKTLGYYYIASMIGTNIHNAFLAFGGFIFPRVSYKLELKDNIIPMYFVARALIALPGWFMIFFLVVGGDFIFELWLGHETYINAIYFIKLYLVFEAAMLLIITPFYFINGSKQIKLNSIFEITLRSAHILFMVIGYSIFGINGVLYGLILSTFINIPLQYFSFQKIVLSIRDYSWLLVILPVCFMLGYLLIGNFIFKVLCAIVFIFSAKLIYFDTAKQYIHNFGILRKA